MPKPQNPKTPLEVKLKKCEIKNKLKLRNNSCTYQAKVLYSKRIPLRVASSLELSSFSEYLTDPPTTYLSSTSYHSNQSPLFPSATVIPAATFLVFGYLHFIFIPLIALSEE